MNTGILEDKKFSAFVVLIIVLSVVFKYSYASYYTPQNSAFEQIAWQYSINHCATHNLSLNELNSSASDPASLGPALLSLITTHVLDSSSALSLALILTLSIFSGLQLFIAYNFFGKTSAYFFGLWLLVQFPIMWPHSVAFYGNGTLNAIFPFLLLCFCGKTAGTILQSVYRGLLFSVLLLFSLQNLFLLPVYLLSGNYIGSNKKLLHLLAFAAVSIAGYLALYSIYCILASSSVVEQIKLLFLNILPEVNSKTLLVNFAILFTDTLSQGLFQFKIDSALNFMAYWAIMICSAVSFGYYILKFKQISSAQRASFLFLIVFFMGFALSVFFQQYPQKFTFSSLRVLSYCLPLLALLIIHALLQNYGAGKVLLALFFVCSLYYTYNFLKTTEVTPPQEHKVVGWLLAKKFRSEPQVLLEIAANAEKPKAEQLMVGYGWGLTAVYLKDIAASDSSKVIALAKTLRSFGINNAEKLREGYGIAFSDGISPALNKVHLATLTHLLNDSAGTQ